MRVVAVVVDGFGVLSCAAVVALVLVTVDVVVAVGAVVVACEVGVVVVVAVVYTYTTEHMGGSSFSGACFHPRVKKKGTHKIIGALLHVVPYHAT